MFFYSISSLGHVECAFVHLSSSIIFYYLFSSSQTTCFGFLETAHLDMSSAFLIMCLCIIKLYYLLLSFLLLKQRDLVYLKTAHLDPSSGGTRHIGDWTASLWLVLGRLYLAYRDFDVHSAAAQLKHEPAKGYKQMGWIIFSFQNEYIFMLFNFIYMNYFVIIC